MIATLATAAASGPTKMGVLLSFLPSLGCFLGSFDLTVIDKLLPGNLLANSTLKHFIFPVLVVFWTRVPKLRPSHCQVQLAGNVLDELWERPWSVKHKLPFAIMGALWMEGPIKIESLHLASDVVSFMLDLSSMISQTSFKLAKDDITEFDKVRIMQIPCFKCGQFRFIQWQNLIVQIIQDYLSGNAPTPIDPPFTIRRWHSFQPNEEAKEYEPTTIAHTINTPPMLLRFGGAFWQTLMLKVYKKGSS